MQAAVGSLKEGNDGHMLSLCDELNNCEQTSAIEVVVEFESDFMQTEQYLRFLDNREKCEDMDAVHRMREELNSFPKEYHTAIVEANAHILSELEYSDMEAIDYAPFAVLKMSVDNLDVEALETLSEAASVEHISVSLGMEVESEASWTETLEEINAYDIVSNSTYTGEGVRIGIYESGGVCDISHSNLVDKDITIRDLEVPLSNHATNVASILSCIAPDARFFVSDVDRLGISWFIEQNCDIVNCSFGYRNNISNGDGTYSEVVYGYRHHIDGLYDYQVKAHGIIVCKSAGNLNTDNRSSKYNPNNRITSPGYAYNVITVGGVNYGTSGIVHANDACYVSNSPYIKPNISAGYTVQIPGRYTDSGTSYATPQVTGCVALLLEAEPSYSLLPELILSLLTSTATKTNDYTQSAGYFDTKVGAGVVNLEKMIQYTQHQLITNTNHTAGAEIYAVEVYRTYGSTLSVGLSWLIGFDLDTGAVLPLTNYGIKIYGPSGNMIGASNLTDSNVELYRQNIALAQTGWYKIVVYQYGAMDENQSRDYLALTYH